MAVRETRVLELSRADFLALVGRYPELLLRVTRAIIAHAWEPRPDAGEVATVAVIPQSPDVDVAAFTHTLVAELSRWGRAGLLRGRDAAAALAGESVSSRLALVEAEHDQVVYECDWASPSPDDALHVGEGLDRLPIDADDHVARLEAGARAPPRRRTNSSTRGAVTCTPTNVKVNAKMTIASRKLAIGPAATMAAARRQRLGLEGALALGRRHALPGLPWRARWRCSRHRGT